MKYFIAYIGTKNENLDHLVARARDLFDMMPNVNSCIVLTVSDEMHISEVTPQEFYDQYASLN
jgi:hypothetical protein